MSESGRLQHIDVLDLGFVDLIDVMGTELTIVNAARVSFGKHKEEWDDRDEQLLKYLIEHRHTSPLEHMQFQFRIKCPLYIRSQWMRHRVWSYNEVSRRYTGKDIDEFYLPEYFRIQSRSNHQASINEPVEDSEKLLGEYGSHIKSAVALYKRLIEAGVCREQARGVLPQAMYTEYYGTVDLHNLLHFIELRISLDAQWEIQQYARALLTIIEPHVPHVVKYFKKRCNID